MFKVDKYIFYGFFTGNVLGLFFDPNNPGFSSGALFTLIFLYVFQDWREK
jgi:hypothetical protein